MSERKVINKYFPPNFDPSRIPKRVIPRDKQHVVRLMTPFSMRCSTCGEYIYKGRKFNARKETVEGENYLGIKVFRFYIRCPQCAGEITYKTDPQHADYVCELGAKRNFEPWREERQEEERTKTRRRLEELHNPIKALENKTYDSKREIEIVEALDEIRTLNVRLERADADAIFERVVNEPDRLATAESEKIAREKEEDDHIIQDAFTKSRQQAQDLPSTLLPNHPQHVNNITTNDLLLGAGLSINPAGMTKRRLDSTSLGIIPKRKPNLSPSNRPNAPI